MGDAHYSLVILGRGGGVENGPFFCLDVTRGSRTVRLCERQVSVHIVGQWRLWKEFQACNVSLSLQKSHKPTSAYILRLTLDSILWTSGSTKAGYPLRRST